MKKNGLAVFKMEREGFKITLKTADAEGATQIISSGSCPGRRGPGRRTRCSRCGRSGKRRFPSEGDQIPMVGTFYCRPIARSLPLS